MITIKEHVFRNVIQDFLRIILLTLVKNAQLIARDAYPQLYVQHVISFLYYIKDNV